MSGKTYYQASCPKVRQRNTRNCFMCCLVLALCFVPSAQLTAFITRVLRACRNLSTIRLDVELDLGSSWITPHVRGTLQQRLLLWLHRASFALRVTKAVFARIYGARLDNPTADGVELRVAHPLGYLGDELHNVGVHRHVPFAQANAHNK